MSKTIHVQRIKEMANKALKNKELTDDQREGVRMLLENILFETDNYGGFGYVAWLDEGGYEKWRADCEKAELNLETLPYLGNQTRRIYY